MSQAASAAAVCAGFVLAGGRSSRMGADKALVELGGRPLLVYALDMLRAAGMEPTIAGARSELSAFAPVIADAEADCGPLGGICGALELCGAEMAVFVSVDTPLMPVSAIEYLVRHASISKNLITMYSLNGFAQTFPVVVRREAFAALNAELAAGRRGCFAAFAAAARERGEHPQVTPVEFVAQAGQVREEHGWPPQRWFANVNTRDELARVAAWLR